MSEDNSDLGAFLAGFVIGGLVGAATALILAPQSGEQTRGQISSISQEWRETGEQRVQQYRDISSEKIHDYQDRAAQILHMENDDSETLADQTRIVLDDGAEQVNAIVEDIVSDSEDNSDTA